MTNRPPAGRFYKLLLSRISLFKNYINKNFFSNIYLYEKYILSGVFRKLYQPAASPAAPHPGYSISKDRRDGDIQALLGAAKRFIYYF